MGYRFLEETRSGFLKAQRRFWGLLPLAGLETVSRTAPEARLAILSGSLEHLAMQLLASSCSARTVTRPARWSTSIGADFPSLAQAGPLPLSPTPSSTFPTG